MTQQPATEQEYLIPDEIARAVVLPGSHTDEENTVFPAYAWLRANNPLGLAKVEGFDPIWLVTKYADIMAIERNPELFPAGVNNAILNDQAGDNFIRSLTGGTTGSWTPSPSWTRLSIRRTAAWSTGRSCRAP